MQTTTLLLCISSPRMSVMHITTESSPMAVLSPYISMCSLCWFVRCLYHISYCLLRFAILLHISYNPLILRMRLATIQVPQHIRATQSEDVRGLVPQTLPYIIAHRQFAEVKAASAQNYSQTRTLLTIALIAMPALANLLATRAGVALEAILDTAEPLEADLLQHVPTLTRRILIPCCNSSSPSGLVQAETVDPWQKSGKYALAWVYFCIILLVCASAIRWYQYFNDKIRTALQEEKTKQEMLAFSPDSDFPMSTISSMQSTQKFFPPKSPVPGRPETGAPGFASRTINIGLAFFRSVFYRPMPTIRVRKGWRPIILPSLGAVTIIALAVILVLGYDLIPQPWYWQSIRYGSPPVAIRAGMIAVAMVPWIIALSMKANFITLLTGIGHERLNVLHRWLAYIFILLSLIHTIPFYITPIWDAGGYRVFRSFFTSQHVYVYGSGR